MPSLSAYFPASTPDNPVTLDYDIVYSPATRVVAPINSDTKADYYTDGTADNVEIQAAIDVVSSLGGGKVYIKAGTYSISSTINVPANLTVEGDGYVTNLVLASAGSIMTFPDGDSNGHRLFSAIKNIRFYGSSLASSVGIDCGDYGQEFGIYNCWFHTFNNTSTICVKTTTNKKFQIIGCFFGGSQNKIRTGISLSATGDVQIVGNNFHEFASGISGITEKTQITGNVFYSGDSFVSDTVAIFLGTTTGLQIANIVGNTISDCDYGIKCGQTSNTGGMNIVGNFFRNIEKNAIYVRGAYHTIMGNYFQEIAVSGTGNDSHGIVLADGAQFVKSIANNIYNTHSNMGYGIALLDTSSGANSIHANTITGAVTGRIRLGTALLNIVRDNIGYLTEASGTASVANGATAGTVTHGLSATPTVKDISLTPINNMGSASKLWVASAGATTFVVNVNTDPGATTTQYAWKAEIL